MSLPHALLGVLSYQPPTGYDLKTAFNASLRMFWNASLPQIYRTLHKMEESGWVLSSVEHQESKPNKKVYEITSDGKEELRRWLRKPIEGEQEKNELMIKVFFGRQMERHELIDIIRELRERKMAFIARSEGEFKQSADHFAQRLDARDDVPFWLLTLDFGVRKARMIVEWCDSALKILEE